MAKFRRVGRRTYLYELGIETLKRILGVALGRLQGKSYREIANEMGLSIDIVWALAGYFSGKEGDELADFVKELSATVNDLDYIKARIDSVLGSATISKKGGEK